MTTEWPRGSEWRKWDLHLHAPGTKLNDQFRVDKGNKWDKYCRKLHDSDVEAFGITDYFSANGYFKVSNHFRKRYAESHKIFFCNIELRLSEVVNTANEEVNIHVLFNPSWPDCDENIRSFLQSLKTNQTKPRNLAVKASQLTTEHAFAAATTTRAFIREALVNTYGRDADFLDCVLIITAANNDGIRAMRRKRKLLITDEIDKFSDAFFGNSNNVDYFLNSHRGEDKNEYFDPKPVLSGCDAHSFAQLDETLGQVVSTSHGIVSAPTWIKADLTFDGLKQIIFEPENRVYIGEEPEIKRRVRNHKTKYIDKLKVTNTDGYNGQHGTWFSHETILLGKELVAIIGNKGSGKSAVTDIIGLLGNSHNQTSKIPRRSSEELFSFLNSEKFLKRGCAKNFTGKLIWYDGEPDCKILNAKSDTNLPEKVEYLPQKYLERICANIADDEFRATLDEVVFRYVRPQQRYGRRSLADLIAYLTRQAAEEIQNSKRDLHLVNRTVVSIERKLVANYQKKIDEKIRRRREELAAHESARPAEKAAPLDQDSATPETAEIARLTRKISDYSKSVRLLATEQIELIRDAEELRQVKQAINRQAERLTKLKRQYDEVLKSSGLQFDNIVRLNLDFSDLNKLVAEKVQRVREIKNLLATEEEIREKFASQQGTEKAIALARSESIVCKKANLQKRKTDLVVRQTKPAREFQVYLTELARWDARKKEILGNSQNPTRDSLKGLEIESKKIKNVYQKDLHDARVKQKRVSNELLQKKRDLTGVYDQIKQSIDEQIAKNRDDLGDYSISIEAGLRFDSSFYDRFLGFINQGRRGSFYGSEKGRAMLRQLCDSANDWENDAEVFLTLKSIVKALHVDRRSDLPSLEGKARDVFKQMKNQSEPVVNLYDYLFGFDYLNPKYDLKVDQKDLSELSPGERGGLLLIFYLILDRQDIPLIIDQPEDNLDNKSVYEILVTFIKQAKKRRQIILVTHNPNLAVVADAEQIIYVSIDKMHKKHDFDFFSGSIENSKINAAVVDILEGTLPAFDNRRLKYRRPK